MAKTDQTGRPKGYWDAYQKNAELPYDSLNKVGNRSQYSTASVTSVAPARVYAGGGGVSDKVTAAQKRAAKNLGGIAKYNAKSTKDQLKRTMANYDLADTQNRDLADVQYDQNSRKAAGERFAANKKLQMAASNIIGSSGNAMEGSSRGALSGMLKTRTDLDSGEVLGTLATNQDAVRNALTESLNANVIARNEAASNAEFALRGIEADTAAQRNNINSKLYARPGTKGKTRFGSKGYANKRQTAANKAARAGYIV